MPQRLEAGLHVQINLCERKIGGLGGGLRGGKEEERGGKPASLIGGQEVNHR